MEGNEGPDLAQDMKKDAIETEKYYENVNLELSKIRLENVMIEEKYRQEIEAETEKDIVEYGVYIKFNDEDVKIATIDEEGILIPNVDILKDEKYSDEDRKKLGDMLNLLGLEKDKVDLSKLQEKLKDIEAKTKEEIERDKKQKDKDDSIKDKENEEKEDEEKEDEEIENEENNKDKSDEKEIERIAQKKHIATKNIFIIRKDSKLLKNYPQLKSEKDLYFYRDNDGKIKAEYIDENGQTQPSKFFNESTTKLQENVVSLGQNGEEVKKEKPYQVMTTQGLANTNRNARDVRIACNIEQGYLEFEEIRLGTNGKWTGYGIEGRGREYNSKVIDKLSDTRTNKVRPEDVSDRYEAVENTPLADDNIHVQDLSPRKTIDRFIEEGYNKKEAIKIYNYIIGEKHLTEEAAKEKVNEEIMEKSKKENDRKNEYAENEKTPWGDAESRRQRY